MVFVALVEDDRDIREGLALLIRGTAGLTLVGAYPDAETALADEQALPPDVVLLDVELPGISGVQAIPHLRKRYPDADILMLTVHEDDQTIFDALCAGACGYLAKTTRPVQLLKAIETVQEGGAPMSAHIARRVVGSFKKSADPQLTRRETDILTLLCDGQSYKMIAASLGISRGTVHCHIKKIYRKLQVHSNGEAVARAIRDNLV